jgi:ADP-heptose:LPS heptosyltransferase
VRPAGPLVPGVERIAVLRGNALGDLVVALPALDALRAAYPDAEITLLGREHHVALLGPGRPSPVDRVVALPSGSVGDELRVDPGLDRDRLLDSLAAERFDLVVQLHGGGRNSNAFVGRLGARLTAGSRTPDAPPLDRWIPYEHYQPEITRYLEVVGLVGAAPVGIEPRLGTCEEDVAAAREALPALDGHRYVVLHPGATDPRRRWPVRHFATVGRAMAAGGLRVVITGIPAEAELLSALAGALDGVPGGPPVVADRLSLPALVGLLVRAEVVVSNDTGPLHLAVAVGTPTVGIFWIGNLINAGPFTRRLHRPLISWQVTCPVCGANAALGRCEHDVSFVEDVTVDSAIDAARSLLEARAWATH